MGKDWHWGGRSTKKTGGGGGGGGTASARGCGTTTTSCGGGDDNKENSATTTTPSGCMSAVLQFFDFHQFQFPLHHHPQPPLKPHYSFLPEDPTLLKGVEAPRNSLESEEEESSLSSVSKEEENLNFPVGIQIKTSADTKLKVGATNDLSSESSCSPATKTPNLVARLMGLDLLPDYSVSPSSSSHQTTQFPLGKSHLHDLQPQNSKRQRLHHRPSCHHHRCFLDNDVTGTRSLPETPRISAARRSDVEHRLSLQINRENIGASEELDLSGIMRRKKEMMKQENESSSSPSYYARQIVKQVKESVGRRVGLDITNTVKFREQGKDLEHPPPIKSKKNHKVYTKNGDEFSPSCSPRLRFLETKTKPVSPSSTKDQKPHSPKPLSPLSSSSIDNQSQPKIPSKPKPKLQPVPNQQPPMKKCKKPARENFRTRLKKSPKTSDTIRSKQEEPFVGPSTAKNSNHSDKKCKKTPLSTDLLNISVPFKKEPSPPTTKIHQKPVHEVQSSKCSSSLSSCRTPKYKEEDIEAEVAVAAPRNMLAAPEEGSEEKAMATTTTTTTTAIQVQGAAEFQYISRILKRTGIERDTTISSTRFLSPSLPLLQPSIFHQIENENEKSSHPTTNLMLIFHLVNEFLPEIIKPQFKNCQETTGGEVYEKMCEKIKSIRCRNCEVLEDIDKMVDEDLPKWKLRRGYVEEEGEGMVAEIERDILEELVAETTVDYCAVVRTETARVEYCEYGRASDPITWGE